MMHMTELRSIQSCRPGFTKKVVHTPDVCCDSNGKGNSERDDWMRGMPDYPTSLLGMRASMALRETVRNTLSASLTLGP